MGLTLKFSRIPLMANITVTNHNKKHPINERFVVEIVRDILNILKKRSVALEIIFLSDPAIRVFNKKYKKSDRATDVLSFDLGSCGQIFISSDMALRNSRIFNTPLGKELVLYVIHGILHLYGYDDGNSQDRLRMFRRQDFILEKLCAKVRLSQVLTPR
jgi:probable rRNA maturation factor